VALEMGSITVGESLSGEAGRELDRMAAFAAFAAFFCAVLERGFGLL
jgi:hypothetical protein